MGGEALKARKTASATGTATSVARKSKPRRGFPLSSNKTSNKAGIEEAASNNAVSGRSFAKKYPLSQSPASNAPPTGAMPRPLTEFGKRNPTRTIAPAAVARTVASWPRSILPESIRARPVPPATIATMSGTETDASRCAARSRKKVITRIPAARAATQSAPPKSDQPYLEFRP